MGEVKTMPYQYMVKVGDIVEMYDGKTGIIEKVEFFVGGNSKGVKVRPTKTPWYRRLCMKRWFYDGQINGLRLLAREEKRKEVKK